MKIPPPTRISIFFIIFILLSISGYSGCSSFSHTVGGTLTGLQGTVVLQNNLADDLTLDANGVFTFSTPLPNDTNYNVTILRQPSGQTCSVSNGTGSISNIDVTNILVDCSSTSTSYNVGGTLSHLGDDATVVLQNNGGDNLTLTSNGSFNFSTKLENGATYDVTVLTNPSRQICTITNGSGTVASANITNITVICVTTNPIFFLTATSHNGDLNGISGADVFCMADTNKPSTGTYKAFLVDGVNRRACSTANCSGGISENIDWVLAPDTTYYRSNQTTPIMTTNSSGVFVFGTLTNSFLGAMIPYWSGFAPAANWTTGTRICSLWTSSSGSGGDANIGFGGIGDAVSGDAIAENSRGCNNSVSLICVEQ